MRDSSSSTLDVPVRVGPGGSLYVVVFDDDDSDGVRDSNEAGVSGIFVCFTEQQLPDQPSPGFGTCGATEGDGVATSGLLPEGDYGVSIAGPTGGLVTFPESITIRVTSGADTRLDYGVEMLTPEEQVIPAGTGEVVSLDVCYSDPAWVRPDFDSSWTSDIEEQVGQDEAIVRAIYKHSIYEYSIYNSGIAEMLVWSKIAGVPSAQMRRSCADPTGRVYFLAGYEPLDVVRSGNISQVRVRRSNAGLTAIMLPEPYFSNDLSVPEQDISSAPPVHLFVDENYAPIVRCGDYNGCEWNDGTPPTKYGGY